MQSSISMGVLPRAEASQASDAIKRLKNILYTIKIDSHACVYAALLYRREEYQVGRVGITVFYRTWQKAVLVHVLIVVGPVNLSV